MCKYYKIVIVQLVACLFLLVSTLSNAALIKLNINNPNGYPLIFPPYSDPETGNSCVSQGTTTVSCTVEGINTTIKMYLELYWTKQQNRDCVIDIGLFAQPGSSIAHFGELASDYVYTLQPSQWDGKSNLSITMNITGLKNQACK